MIFSILLNPILISAFIGAAAASVASGVIGSYVVVKRVAFISGSIAHSVLGGIGFFLWLQRRHGMEWANPLLGALFAAIVAALLLAWVRFSSRDREDSIIAALWTIGMSLGVIFISLTPGYNVELTNYLIGNLLWVTPTDLAILWALDAVVLATVFALHKRFLAVCFDEEQAFLQGVWVKPLYILLLLLIAVSIVLLIHVVGIILVMTMLILPPSIANLFTKRLSRMMLVATGLNLFFSLSGIWISYAFDWPPGATIALYTGLVYVLTSSLSKVPREKSYERSGA